MWVSEASLPSYVPCFLEMTSISGQDDGCRHKEGAGDGTGASWCVRGAVP